MAIVLRYAPVLGKIVRCNGKNGIDQTHSHEDYCDCCKYTTDQCWSWILCSVEDYRPQGIGAGNAPQHPTLIVQLKYGVDTHAKIIAQVDKIRGQGQDRTSGNQEQREACSGTVGDYAAGDFRFTIRCLWGTG